MIDHVTIRASDRVESERFYETVLPVIGIDNAFRSELGAEWGDFSLAPAGPGESATRRLHVAFAAPSRELVDAFWRTGTEAGYGTDGPPRLRPQYAEDFYGGFLHDPDGNSIEAVHGGRPRPGPFDHLSINVADVGASARFYELIAKWSGCRLDHEQEGFAHFTGPDASLTLTHGEPTEQLHLAFAATDNRAVQDFHHAALEAGYRDNGAAGERSLYHAGYYGAYVLDPDGNNIEVVNHNR